VRVTHHYNDRPLLRSSKIDAFHETENASAKIKRLGYQSAPQ